MSPQLISRINARLHLAQFGVYSLRSASADLLNLRIANRRFRVAIPQSEVRELTHELKEILINDCYRLGEIKGPVTSILDVGANVGLFGIAARHHFPNAIIHMYEPNDRVKDYLTTNSKAIDGICFSEAVGSISGKVNLEFKINSLHTTASDDLHGQIPQVSFQRAIERLGGQVDLVKLDCEGSEWDIFADTDSWKKVRHLTMEYHLWAQPGLEVDGIFRAIKRIGFFCRSHFPHPKGEWGLIQASRA